jgi:hypothetical protein
VSADNVIPFPGAAEPPKPTPLADSMRQLAFGFQLQTGQEATHILLPRKALRSEVKPWVEQLCAEVEGLGKPHHVFDRIVSTPDGETSCIFCDLQVAMYDGSDVIVGRADVLH